MAEGGPGLVAVGGCETSGDPDGAVWVSADGQSWARVPDEQHSLGGPGIQLISDVTRGGPGLVAVGQDDPQGSPEKGWVDADAAVWVSSDGHSWTRIPHDEEIFGGPDGQRMMCVTAGGPGLVAVGSDYKDGSGWPDVAVWVSADGYEWTRVPDNPGVFGGPGGQEVLSLTAGGPGLVAVGSVNSYWNAAVWVSGDGYVWTPIRLEGDPPAGPSKQEYQDVTAGGPGFVAVGHAGTDAGSDALVCTSADGYTWTRVDSEVLGGPGGQNGTQVAAWEEGLIVVGSDESADDSAPAVWMSADGHVWSRIHDVTGLEAPGEESVDAVVVWGSILVAAGATTDPDGGVDAAIWLGTLNTE